MSTLDELIRERRSIRRFASGDVPEEALEALIEAARWAPSAGNAQTVRLHVVRSSELRRRLAAAALGQRFVAEAPVALVVAVDLDEAARAYGDRGVALYCLQDAAAAIQNVLLAAHARGLGTCWVGAFDERAASEALRLPPRLRPVAIVPIGVPAESPRPPRRKPASEIVVRHG